MESSYYIDFPDKDKCSFPAVSQGGCNKFVLRNDQHWAESFATVPNVINAASLWKAVGFDRIDEVKRHNPQLVELHYSSDIPRICKDCQTCIEQLLKSINEHRLNGSKSIDKPVLSPDEAKLALKRFERIKMQEIEIEESELLCLGEAQKIKETLDLNEKLDGKILIILDNTRLKIFLQFYPEGNPEKVEHKDFLRDTPYAEMDRYNEKNMGGCHISAQKINQQTLEFKLSAKSGAFGKIKYQYKIVDKIIWQLKNLFGSQSNIKTNKLAEI